MGILSANRRRYIILSQSESSARALAAWLEAVGATVEVGGPNWIVWEGELTDSDSVEAFHVLADRIESSARGGDSSIPLNRVVVLVDSIELARMEASKGQWSHVVAMLILAFPEIRWVFGAFLGGSEQEQQDLRNEHGLRSLLHKCQRNPILDVTGLRELVRNRTKESLGAGWGGCPTRDSGRIAAAIDEEESYAYLNAYTAYRFGFRSEIITRFVEMGNRFKTQEGRESHGYSLLLEDMSLKFPDRGENVELLSLERRAKVLDLLGYTDNPRSQPENSRLRVLVTTGERDGDGKQHISRANSDYLQKYKKGYYCVVLKPADGMFGLWEEVYSCWSQVDKEQTGTSGDNWGNIGCFRWPPSLDTEQRDEKKTHGAPGRLLLVAERLLERGQREFDGVSTVGEAIRGAVLATDAMELLGHRAPTLAITALKLKHRYEVLAECLFSGFAHHIVINRRLEEIEREAKALAQQAPKGRQEDLQLNAQMHVLHGVLNVLREFGQFDEEQLCTDEIRKVHFSLHWRLPVESYFLRWIRSFLVHYLNWCLGSFKLFFGALLLWCSVLGLFFFWTGPYGGCDAKWWHAWIDAVVVFLSAGGPILVDSTAQKSPLFLLAVLVAAILGLVHLGIFVSLLFSKLARK